MQYVTLNNGVEMPVLGPPFGQPVRTVRINALAADVSGGACVELGHTPSEAAPGPASTQLSVAAASSDRRPVPSGDGPRHRALTSHSRERGPAVRPGR